MLSADEWTINSSHLVADEWTINSSHMPHFCLTIVCAGSRVIADGLVRAVDTDGHGNVVFFAQIRPMNPKAEAWNLGYVQTRFLSMVCSAGVVIRSLQIVWLTGPDPPTHITHTLAYSLSCSYTLSHTHTIKHSCSLAHARTHHSRTHSSRTHSSLTHSRPHACIVRS